MKQLNLSMKTVRALFISHEHSDHITGLPGLVKKYQLPVFITPDTLDNCNLPLAREHTRSFKDAKPVHIGSISVTPFKKSHDAADPYSFMVSGHSVNIGIITDIGYACKRVLKYFSQCHAAFLESNYCEDMLMKGSYPYPLKKRISGDRGHLSNNQALDLFINYRSANLQLLILSHLSKNNNKPELVKKLFKPHAGSTQIVIASRYEASPLFEVSSAANNKQIQAQNLRKGKNQSREKNQTQLSFF
jgi:phosphoribosyl 1,2-cyclic phosphodiesterase